MAEFKVSERLTAEISEFRVAADLLRFNSDISIDGVVSLKTAVRYIREHREIKQLIALYQQLLRKDAADLEAMKKSAEILDESVADSMGR